MRNILITQNDTKRYAFFFIAAFLTTATTSKAGKIQFGTICRWTIVSIRSHAINRTPASTKPSRRLAKVAFGCSIRRHVICLSRAIIDDVAQDASGTQRWCWPDRCRYSIDKTKEKPMLIIYLIFITKVTISLPRAASSTAAASRAHVDTVSICVRPDARYRFDHWRHGVHQRNGRNGPITQKLHRLVGRVHRSFDAKLAVLKFAGILGNVSAVERSANVNELSTIISLVPSAHHRQYGQTRNRINSNQFTIVSIYYWKYNSKGIDHMLFNANIKQ